MKIENCEQCPNLEHATPLEPKQCRWFKGSKYIPSKNGIPNWCPVKSRIKFLNDNEDMLKQFSYIAKGCKYRSLGYPNGTGALPKAHCEHQQNRKYYSLTTWLAGDCNLKVCPIIKGKCIER